MRIYIFLILLLIVFFNSHLAISQSSYRAKIEKNTNLEAQTLFHELNKTTDTLLLQSPTKISHIYSINTAYKREIDRYINTKNYKLPLQNLSKGKHVLVVSQSAKKIVFVIHIIDAFATIERSKLTYN
ncbi:hypothetical protein SAMN04487989_10741 [Bizionia echini]|uniref:Uncharacterized protein n=1 Tax=Bizionia echini TaxID=649333 RepID=A0A1I5D7J6_9FLAO|nr:hypothetical protein [Bizionia echini]SFN95180.1 hypothetical protein SAMN04487989_10741 [Bizionia echini]